jgi:hypothetical protein
MIPDGPVWPSSRDEPGWAAMAKPPSVTPEVTWWRGRAAQVRRAMDSLEYERRYRCACPATVPDWRGRTVFCDAPIGFPHRFGGAILMRRPQDAPRRPTLASLGLVSARNIQGALGGPLTLSGGRRATPRG